MMKTILVLLVCIMPLSQANAQSNSFLIPSLTDSSALYKAYPYYFYLDTIKYYVKYRGDELPIEKYKGRSRYVLWGYKEGDLEIFKINPAKKKKPADTIVYMNKHIQFKNPPVICYLNGVASGKKYTVNHSNQSQFILLAYVEGTAYEETLDFKTVKINYLLDGKPQEEIIENTNIIPRKVMNKIVKSGAKELTINASFLWKTDDSFDANDIVFYLE